MPSRIFEPDPTAHLLAQLRRLAVSGVLGLLLALVAVSASVAVVHIGGGNAPQVLVRGLWIGIFVVAALGVLQLAVAAVLWGVYRRRRAELDA